MKEDKIDLKAYVFGLLCGCPFSNDDAKSANPTHCILCQKRKDAITLKEKFAYAESLTNEELLAIKRGHVSCLKNLEKFGAGVDKTKQ